MRYRQITPPEPGPGSIGAAAPILKGRRAIPDGSLLNSTLQSRLQGSTDFIHNAYLSRLTVPAIVGHVLNSKLNCSEWSDLLRSIVKSFAMGGTKPNLNPPAPFQKFRERTPNPNFPRHWRTFALSDVPCV